MELNRRSFLIGGAALGAAAVSALAGCAPGAPKAAAEDSATANTTTVAGTVPAGVFAVDFEQSAVELEPITDFAAEETYDIVVVGAGCAGVPAVLTALEEGASVACLQKEPVVAANGSGCSGVLKGLSTPGGIARWKWDWARENGWRVNQELFDYYIDHSEETISWIVKKAIEAGCEPKGYMTRDNTVAYDDGEMLANIKVRMSSNNEVMTAMAAMAEQQGATFYYATPAVQLVMDDSGAITGVIGKASDGSYLKLNANKGVILAAGDYMNNDALVARYCEDVAIAEFDRRQLNRTGDGHLLAVTAGSRIVPAGHSKQIHDLAVTSNTMMGCPFLMLDEDGNRFFNEECCMTMWNVPIKYRFPGQVPTMFRFFDSAYAEKFSMCDTASLELIEGKVLPPEDYGKKGIYKADTLEELFEILNVDAAAFKASIERYNQLCAQGVDEDFGKDAQYMTPIDTPPFYGLKYSPGLAAINGGVLVNGNYQVVNAEREPIPGLYAAGVNAGDLCGGVDWIMPGGASNGHCFNAGRYTVIHALTGGLEPSKPCSFEDVADKFVSKDGGFAWEKPESCFHEIQVW